jgi:DNA polymerase type B, organellar and viral
MSKESDVSGYGLSIYKYPKFHPKFTESCRAFCIGVRPGRNYDSDWNKSANKKETDGTDEVLFEDGCIVGFDTEYQNLAAVLEANNEDVSVEANKEKQNLYLSYQFNAKWKGKEWSGIGYPAEGERLSLADFLSWVVSTSPFSEDGKVVCPNQFVLVCHFSRADLPSFSDFYTKRFKNRLMAIRKTFITGTKGAPLPIPLNVNGRRKMTKVCIRDTLLLAPSDAKKLEDIGVMIGVPKVTKVTKAHKEKMIGLMKSDFALFEEYALKDAEIARKFAEEVIKISVSKGGKPTIPLTLTSLGISFVKAVWKEKGYNPDDVNGISPEKKYGYNFKKKSHMFYTDRSIKHPNRHIWNPLATECYHGGRNEQFLFGAGEPGVWTDYDLASAYPTGMSRIGMPDWDNPVNSRNLDELLEHDLVFAQVRFRHPAHIRFPIFPVKESGSVVFPSEGISFCCGPELIVAKNLGLKPEIIAGVAFPTDNTKKPYFDYITYCIENRNQHEKKTVFNSLWKELANGMYGKLAQGLTKRSGYNLRKSTYEQLPDSAITNPFFASYTTSFCRAALAEILNSLPSTVTVCSCTTDGFLSNASPKDIDKATKGEICQEYFKSGKLLRDDLKGPLEIKGKIAQPLGWRTRGQATIERLPDENVILAKSSFKPATENKDEQNEWIIREFEDRFFGKSYAVPTFVGVREMVELEADLYDKMGYKKLSMDYDWKRDVDLETLTTRKVRNKELVYFETIPWRKVEEYVYVKGYWKVYAEKHDLVLKTPADVTGYHAEYSEHIRNPKRRGINRSSSNTTLVDFKKWFAKAYKHHAYGLPNPDSPHYLSYRELDSLMAELGVSGMLNALSNHRNKTFDKPNVIYRKEFLEKAVSELKKQFPAFDTSKVFRES